MACICFMGSASYAEVKDQEKELLHNPDSIEEQWGIKIVAIRLSANGYMIDFRYRVADAKKALPVFNRKTKPYLIDQTTGTRLFVPTTSKLGPLRQTPKDPAPDKKYFILFSNPGKLVKKGGKVTVVIGDFKVENLSVE